MADTFDYIIAGMNILYQRRSVPANPGVFFQVVAHPAV
jgi:hypothetical protein